MTRLRDLFILLLLTQQTLGQSATPPNIIIVLADDLGYGDLSCYNDSSKIQTPNLDRLASGGVRFVDAHSPAAVCTPSRYGLLTGRYPWRSKLKSGVLWAYDWPLIEPERETIASYFKKAGYRTGMTGKWHLGWQWPVKPGQTIDSLSFGGRSEEQTLARESALDFSRPVNGGPMSCGFDYSYAVDIPSLPPFAFMENGIWSGGTPEIVKPEGMSGAKGLMQKGWQSSDMNQRVMEKATAFIQESEGPFFLYLPLNVPHQPVAPFKSYVDKSAAGDYGDVVMEMDDHIGKLLQLLKETGKYDNTIIVFSSDNGSVNDAGDSKLRGLDWSAFGAGFGMYSHRSNGLWRGMKGDAWEGGHRVPLIIHWPEKIPGGRTSDQLISLVDIFPTLATLAGFERKKELTEDGLNFSNVLLYNSKKDVRDHLIIQSSKGVLAARKGKWKYIDCNYSGGNLINRFIPNDQKVQTPGQLYDMERDPFEQNNLYERFPSVVARLRSLIQTTKTL